MQKLAMIVFLYINEKKLLIGISGSDEARADCMDNNIRLFVPKGILTPSQFTILKVAMKEHIDSVTGDDKNDTSIHYYAEEHINLPACYY